MKLGYRMNVAIGRNLCALFFFHLFVDVGDGLVHRLQFFSIGIRDTNIKRLFKLHHQFCIV